MSPPPTARLFARVKSPSATYQVAQRSTALMNRSTARPGNEENRHIRGPLVPQELSGQFCCDINAANRRPAGTDSAHRARAPLNSVRMSRSRTLGVGNDAD